MESPRSPSVPRIRSLQSVSSEVNFHDASNVQMRSGSPDRSPSSPSEDARPTARPNSRKGYARMAKLQGEGLKPGLATLSLQERLILQGHTLTEATANAGVRPGNLREEASSHKVLSSADMPAFEEESDFEPGHGAPAPKHPTESAERTPEMERQRAAAIEKVAIAARKLKEELQRQHQAMLSNRRKRHQTDPSPSMGQDARRAAIEAEAEAGTKQVEPVPAGGVPAVMIFDWDDTLFPTRHVTEVVKALHPKDGPLPSESPYHTDLSAHAQIVQSILLSAREVVGRVSIVTLARRPWVENSAAWYLPGVDFQKLFQEHEIDIFYAREHITRPHIYNAQLEEGVDMFVIAKRNAMLKCLRKLYGPSTKTMHVISVGDSTVEHLAAKEVLWCCPQEAGSYCKTIKLMSDPSVQNLTEELQVLASWLQQIVACEKDFDISFESEDFNDNIMVTLDGAGGPGQKSPRTAS